MFCQSRVVGEGKQRPCMESMPITMQRDITQACTIYCIYPPQFNSPSFPEAQSWFNSKPKINVKILTLWFWTLRPQWLLIIRKLLCVDNGPQELQHRLHGHQQAGQITKVDDISNRDYHRWWLVMCHRRHQTLSRSHMTLLQGWGSPDMAIKPDLSINLFRIPWNTKAGSPLHSIRRCWFN